MSSDQVQIRLPIASNDEKLKHAALVVLKDLEVICRFMNDLVEKQLGLLATVIEIASSRKSYRLRDLIDPRFRLDNLDQANDELALIAKSNLLKVYKIFMHKDYVAQPSQSNLEIIQDIYQAVINLDAASTDCYQITQAPKLVELVNITDYIALCMQNTHMPFTNSLAAKRSPLEKQYGELFREFKIQIEERADEQPAHPVDGEVSKNKDAYTCYYLKWMVIYLNGLAINQYKIFSTILPILERNFSQICVLIKVHLNMQFDARAGSHIDETFSTLPVENHHIEPRNNTMLIENIAAITQPERNEHHLSKALSDVVMSLLPAKQTIDMAEAAISDALKHQFEKIKLAIRMLHVKRAEMFIKLPGLKSYSEILAATVNTNNPVDFALEDILGNFIPMMEETLQQIRSLKSFGECEVNAESIFFDNLSTTVTGLCGSSLKTILEARDFCVKHYTPQSLIFQELQTAKAEEHDKKEEESYRVATQSPKTASRSRSGSIGDHSRVVSKSSPRTVAAAASTSDPVMIVRALSRDSRDGRELRDSKDADKDKGGNTFLSALSSAIRAITPGTQKKDTASSPRLQSPSLQSPRFDSPTQQFSPRDGEQSSADSIPVHRPGQ